MKLALRGACALLLAAAVFAGSANRVSALPMHTITAATGELIPAACKYGSGKCANVKPVQPAPSTVKHGPQDPTVDPDCAHYGNCHGGNPEGGSASARGGATKSGTGIVKPASPTISQKR